MASSAGRYERETYCCLNGTVSSNYPSAWYAFDAGVARFYVLEASWSDLNIGSASPYENDYDYHWRPSTDEYQWLAQDLAAHPTGLKFAFWHYPLYSDNSTETSDTFLQGASRLEGLLSSYGVNIGFNGHAHIYQRNVPSGANGLITYVTGGGGAKVEPIGAGIGCSATDAYGIGWSYSANGGAGGGYACGSAPVPTSLTQVFHFLLVTVNGTQVRVAPTDEMGRTFDVQIYNFPDTIPPTPTRTATAHADQHADQHADEHADEHADQHADQYADQHADEHADQHADEHADQHADQYTDEYADQHADQYADSDLHPDALADAYRDPPAHGDTDRDARRRADWDAHRRAGLCLQLQRCARQQSLLRLYHLDGVSRLCVRLHLRGAQ